MSSNTSFNTNTNTNLSSSLPSSIYNTVVNPLFILTILVVIVIIILIVNIFDFDLGYSGTSSSNGSFGYGSRPNYYTNEDSGILGYLSYFIFLILFLIIIYYALYYLFGIELYSFIMNFFYPKPTPYNPAVSYVPNYLTNQGSSTVPTTTSTPLPAQEVYNVPGNFYTYDDANAVCKAFGGRLAKYKEVEEAYNNGGEWCNYGWSDEQMALFPTQQNTYDALQKKKGAEHNCGRPGINGGYLANPSIKFGANCYGVKPQINSQEQQNMQNVSSTPITQDDINFQNKVDYWKGKLDSITLAPFNYSEWYERQNITNLTTSPNPTQQTTPFVINVSPTTQTTVPVQQKSITYPVATNSKSPSPNVTMPSTYTTTNPTQSLTPGSTITTTPTGNTGTAAYVYSETTSITSPPNSSWWSTFWSYFAVPTFPPSYSSTTTPYSSSPSSTTMTTSMHSSS
jgi:hypothetical protein